MSSLPKNMGGSDSTTNVVNAGIHIFNTYHNKNLEPFIEDITDYYIEADNIKVLLTDYSNFLATTYIHKFFNKKIHSNSTTKLNTSTLNNYLSKVILMLKDKFPKNCV